MIGRVGSYAPVSRRLKSNAKRQVISMYLKNLAAAGMSALLLFSGAVSAGAAETVPATHDSETYAAAVETLASNGLAAASATSLQAADGLQLAQEGTFAAWVLAVVLLREFAVSGMRLVAVEKGRVIAAGWSGKVKTASTMVCICLILLGIPQVLNYVCQGVILVTTVYSGIEYFAKNADVFKEVK